MSELHRTPTEQAAQPDEARRLALPKFAAVIMLSAAWLRAAAKTHPAPNQWAAKLPYRP